MAKRKVQFTKEQQEQLLNLVAGNDQLKAVKRLCGITDPVPPTGEQITGCAETKTYKDHEYVSIPYVKLADKDSAKGVFLRREIARQVAEEVLRFCDENGW